MEENKDIHEENLIQDTQTPENTETQNQEDLSQKPTAEELLAEDKHR